MQASSFLADALEHLGSIVSFAALEHLRSQLCSPRRSDHLTCQEGGLGAQLDLGPLVFELLSRELVSSLRLGFPRHGLLYLLSRTASQHTVSTPCPAHAHQRARRRRGRGAGCGAGVQGGSRLIVSWPRQCTPVAPLWRWPPPIWHSPPPMHLSAAPLAWRTGRCIGVVCAGTSANGRGQSFACSAARQAPPSSDSSYRP